MQAEHEPINLSIQQHKITRKNGNVSMCWAFFFSSQQVKNLGQQCRDPETMAFRVVNFSDKAHARGLATMYFSVFSTLSFLDVEIN